MVNLRNYTIHWFYGIWRPLFATPWLHTMDLASFFCDKLPPSRKEIQKGSKQDTNSGGSCTWTTWVEHICQRMRPTIWTQHLHPPPPRKLTWNPKSTPLVKVVKEIIFQTFIYWFHPIGIQRPHQKLFYTPRALNNKYKTTQQCLGVAPSSGGLYLVPILILPCLKKNMIPPISCFSLLPNKGRKAHMKFRKFYWLQIRKKGTPLSLSLNFPL